MHGTILYCQYFPHHIIEAKKIKLYLSNQKLWTTTPWGNFLWLALNFSSSCSAKNLQVTLELLESTKWQQKGYFHGLLAFARTLSGKVWCKQLFSLLKNGLNHQKKPTATICWTGKHVQLPQCHTITVLPSEWTGWNLNCANKKKKQKLLMCLKNRNAQMFTVKNKQFSDYTFCQCTNLYLVQRYNVNISSCFWEKQFF